MQSSRPRSRSVTVLVAILAVAPALAPSPPAAAESATSAEISVIGADGTSAVVCGNTETATALARQRRVTLQKNNCRSTADGGSVELENVEIVIDQDSENASAQNAALVAASGAVRGGKASATSTCVNLSTLPARQRNNCRSDARGGRVLLHDVQFVVHEANGRASVHSRVDIDLQAGNGTATATCKNVAPDLAAQRDDCVGRSTGGRLDLRDVDVIIHQAGGGQLRRSNVDVLVKGGDASATVYCLNSIDGGGKRVVQINNCRARAHGGDAVLRHVTIHTYQA